MPWYHGPRRGIASLAPPLSREHEAAQDRATRHYRAWHRTQADPEFKTLEGREAAWDLAALELERDYAITGEL